MTRDVDHWTGQAMQWTTWARTSAHDAFWPYRSRFEVFVGPGAGPALEIGAGEGRICRVLGDLGYHVTAVEPVAALLEAAKDHDSAAHYVQATAAQIPLPGAAYPLVVLYNVLMDVDDLDAALAEAMRCLAPGGRLIVGIVHPVADLIKTVMDTGDWEGEGSYFEPRHFDHPVTDAEGLRMHFVGWQRPMSAYTDALLRAGARLQRLEEPQPDPAHPWANARWRKLPLFLWIEATKSQQGEAA